MRILILGSGGFLGRNLVEQLPYQLLTPSKEELDLAEWFNPMLATDEQKSKLTVDKYFNNHKDIDVVINCVNTDDPKDNESVYYNLSHHFDKAKKWIFFGSGAEYNKTLPIVNVIENEWKNRPEPQDDYSQHKCAMSFRVENPDKFPECKNLIILRLFGVFGKYEDIKRRFISKALLDNMAGRDITIYQNVKFSYVWVNDLVKIIDWFINNKPEYQFYNVGGRKLSLVEIAKKVGKYRVLKRGMANEYTCNDSRLRKETGIKYTAFNKSLKELRKYYE